MSLDPILLRGSLHETIWGGQHLSTVAGKDLPPGATVGESWETAVESVALNAPYDGRNLGDITDQLGKRLYGEHAKEIFGDRFPLLAKFIDAHDWLSVQVHPDDTYARIHEHGKLGKTEAWRILRTDPDAQIMHGFTQPATREEVSDAIRLARLEELTYRMPVKPDDVVINHAGTLHATGAGIVLYEIQEYSDVTYRLYDFGRVGPDGKPRELHVERGLDVLDYQPLTQHLLNPTPYGDTPGTRLLVACHHFALAEAQLLPARDLRRATDGQSCHIITMIAGQARLDWEQGTANLPLGQTVVIPAEAMQYTLSHAGSGAEAHALISWVPMLDEPQISAWLAAQDGRAFLPT